MKNLRSSGFGLIEILIAVVIVSFGVLAVGKLQTSLITSSADTKARSEALAIAQARMELMRDFAFLTDTASNYVNAESFGTAFLEEFSTGSTYQAYGTNAVFTVKDITSANGDSVNAEVLVSWIASDNESQSVSVTSEITYTDPAGTSYEEKDKIDPFVDAPTGRAFIGKGTVDDYTTADDCGGPCGNNTDGTRVLAVASSGDETNSNLLLAVGDDVVLTLEEACERTITTDADTSEEISTYFCTDFVKVSGRVYIHEDYNTNLPSQHFVLASDAAFCARYYTNGEGNVVTFESDTSADGYTGQKTIEFNDLKNNPSSDFRFFDYTCYLGGGWHGNIGVLFDEADNKQLVCVGDPSSSENPVSNQSRRAYRGMVWRYAENDIDKTPVLYSADDNDVQELDLDAIVGTVRYHSWGIADAAVFPGDVTSETVLNQKKHDFFVAATDISGVSDCADVAALEPSLLDNNNDEFFCLNEAMVGAVGIAIEGSAGGYNSSLDNVRYYDLVENERGSFYNQFYGECPYDPTNPPNFLYVLKGKFVVTGGNIFGGSSDFLNAVLDVTTSKGNNCQFTDESFDLSSSGEFDLDSSTTSDVTDYVAYFRCNLYDPGEEQGVNLNPLGWDGTIDVVIDEASSDNFTCETNEIALNNITADIEDQLLECSLDENIVVAQDDAVSVIEGNEMNYLLGAESITAFEIDVLANDTYPGDSPVITNVSIISESPLPAEPSNVFAGVVDGGSGYKLYYSPSVGYLGITQITYTMKESALALSSYSATVTINVTSSDNPVYAEDDSGFFVASDATSVLIPIDELISNDTVLDGVASVIIGIDTYQASETYDFDPNVTFGTDEFEYTLIDADGDEGSATVYVDVRKKFALEVPLSILSGQLESVASTAGGASCGDWDTSDKCYSPDVSEPWSGIVTITAKSANSRLCVNGNKYVSYDITFTDISDDATSNIDISLVSKNSECP